MTTKIWNPIQELNSMESILNRMWSNNYPGEEYWNIAINVSKKDDVYTVSASIPGINPNDVDVSIEDNVLTIRAERKESDEDNIKYLIKEQRSGSFYRALRLPDTIDTSKIQSSYKNGILYITLPKAEELKKKQIKIEVAPSITA